MVEEAQDARKAVILEALRKGNSRTAAFGAVGVVRDTFYNWLRADRTFSDAVARAEAEAEQWFLDRLKAGAAEDWRAAESWLKRARRADWGDQLDLKRVPTEALVALLMASMQSGETVEALMDGETQDAEFTVQDAGSPTQTE